MEVVLWDPKVADSPMEEAGLLDPNVVVVLVDPKGVVVLLGPKVAVHVDLAVDLLGFASKEVVERHYLVAVLPQSLVGEQQKDQEVLL